MKGTAVEERSSLVREAHPERWRGGVDAARERRGEARESGDEAYSGEWRAGEEDEIGRRRGRQYRHRHRGDSRIVIGSEKRLIGSGSGAGMAFLAAVASVALGGAGACLYSIRPRDPLFEVVKINLKGLNLRFCTDSPMLMAVVDVELVLSIKVTNENVVPIEYTSTIMDIFYRGTLLGQAQVEEGNQAANSTKVIEVPCKLDGLEMTNHVKDLFKDVTRREMDLHAVVTIAGHARVWKWTHNFEIHVTSDIKVDPIFLNVIGQENKVELEIESPI